MTTSGRYFLIERQNCRGVADVEGVQLVIYIPFRLRAVLRGDDFGVMLRSRQSDDVAANQTGTAGDVELHTLHLFQ